MDPMKLLKKSLDFAINASPKDRMGAFNNNLATIASDPVHRMSFGGDMAPVTPWAVNPNSIEAMANSAGGWKQPGVKSQFDYAMLTKDPETLKATLPAVPEEYLTRGFGPQVYETLLKIAKQGAAPTAMQKVIQSMGNGIKPL